MNVLARMWPAAITAIMAYCGYVGARMFRRDLTRVYLFYLIFIAIVRISFTVKWSIEPDVSTSAQVFLVISSVLQLVIAHFVWRFYSLLPTTEEESRFIQFVAEHQSGRGLV
jgi:membrane protein YdbS with pleckstrin-like domain